MNPDLYFQWRPRYRLNGEPVYDNPFKPWSIDDVFPFVDIDDLCLVGYDELPEDEEIEAWLESIWCSDWPLQFLIERCCDDGELLPLELRETRLKVFPLAAVLACEDAIASAPCDYEDELFFIISWALRIDRARRNDRRIS
jgi:hypothetical protein